MKVRDQKYLRVASVVVAAALAVAVFPGCKKKEPPAQSPVKVDVRLAKTIVVPEYIEYPVSTTGVATVEIRARVDGYLQSVDFKSGDVVKANQRLFKIDPRSYQAQVDMAKAQLIKAQADLNLSKTKLDGIEQMYKQGAAAVFERDQAIAQRDVSAAQVAMANANLEDANINLGYTDVLSPVAGKVSYNMVDAGNLIKAGQTLLTTVVNADQIYAYFNIGQSDIIRLRRMYPEGGQAETDTIPAELQLPDENDFPHAGIVDFADNQQDPSTGTIKCRAIFNCLDKDGKRNVLYAGVYGRIRIPISKGDFVAIDETAVQTDQVGKYVLIIGNDGKVARADVKVGGAYKKMRVIQKEFLPENAEVIVNGIQRVRVGMAVEKTLLPEIPGLDYVSKSLSQPAAVKSQK